MNIAFTREASEAALKMTPAQKALMQQRGKKIYLGHERREGWSGEIPFYLFWCEVCEHWAKDYPHGHIERQYLNCPHCGAHYSFVPWWAVFKALWQDFSARISVRRK